MYVCIYIYIYIYIHTYTYTYIYIPTYIYIYGCGVSCTAGYDWVEYNGSMRHGGPPVVPVPPPGISRYPHLGSAACAGASPTCEIGIHVFMCLKARFAPLCLAGSPMG